MSHAKLLLVIAAAATLTSGCQSGPAKVCAKIDELADKAAKGDKTQQEMAAKMKQESSTCVVRMKKMEEADPEVFKKASVCIEDATELKQVISCFFKAAMGDKQIKSPDSPAPVEKPNKAEPAPAQ